MWRFGLVGNVIGRINKVNQPQLVLGRVTISRWVNHLSTSPRSTQFGNMGRRNEYKQKLGRKQAHYQWSDSVNRRLAEG